MAPKRTTRATATTTPQSTTTTTAPQLISNENEQRRIFVLPKNLSAEALIITLPNPANKSKCRYYFCPATGLYEFTKVGALPGDPRSWLVIQEQQSSKDSNKEASFSSRESQNGYVLETPDLFMATPMDPLFFLLHLFSSTSKELKSSFRLDDDYIDVLTESSPELASALRLNGFRDLLIRRLRAVSHVQEFGDDVLLKPDELLLAQTVLAKARNMTAEAVWPSSLEEAFVRKQLQVPITPTASVIPQLPTPEQSMTASDLESQESESAADLLQASNSPDVAPALDPLTAHIPPQVTKLMRLRVALQYITSSYMPKDLRASILTTINSEVDFAALNAHLRKVEDAHAQVQALRSITDNVSRKRGMDDDEAAEARAEKKRKKEEEDKRKKAESRALKELKKVDVSGMKKLSSFFQKSSTAATSK